MSMTKQERLNDLILLDAFFRECDKLFDAGWREYAKELRAKNANSNKRILRALITIKGIDFVKDLIQFMKATKTEFNLIQIDREPTGIQMKDNRFSNIPEMWFDQRPRTDPGFYSSKVFIQVKKDR